MALLQSHVAEAVQLRGLVYEQQRALRVASRQIEQLRNGERLLQDDLNKVRAQGGNAGRQSQDRKDEWESK